MGQHSEIERLSAEASKKGRTLTAEDVVDAARDENAYPALHEHLWKVPEHELAAEARLARAHKLIIRCTFRTEEGSVVRAFVHVPQDKGYHPTQKVLSNVNLAVIKLQELKADIERSKAKLASFRAILPDDLATEIERAFERLQYEIDTTAARTAGAAA